MKVAVTGANGFVGTALVNELLLQGYEVIAIVRNQGFKDSFSRRNLKMIECPFEKYDSMAERIGLDCDIDVFYHLAWEGTSGTLRSNADVQMQNVIYTKIAVEQAKKCGCKRFVYAGSIMEYEAVSFVHKDGTQPGINYVYSTAKLAADYIAKITAQNDGMQYINTVISNIYGAGEQSERFLNQLVRKLLDNAVIELTEGKQLYDFIYITDAVRAMILAGCYGERANYYYIGNQSQIALREYVEEAKRITKSCSELRFGAIPYQGPYLTFEEIDTKKMFEEFGFLPEISFDKGVEKLQESLTKR